MSTRTYCNFQFISVFPSASRRNTVLPDSPPVVTAKKSTAGLMKRGPYKQREPDEVKRARITIDDDDGKGKKHSTRNSIFSY